jgi:hypothetical protein
MKRIVVCDSNVKIIYIGKVCKVPVYANFVSEGQLTQPSAVVFGDVVAGGKNL